MNSVWVIEYPSYSETSVAFTEAKMQEILDSGAQKYTEAKVFKINNDRYVVNYKDCEEPDIADDNDPMIVAVRHYDK